MDSNTPAADHPRGFHSPTSDAAIRAYSVRFCANLCCTRSLIGFVNTPGSSKFCSYYSAVA